MAFNGSCFTSYICCPYWKNDFWGGPSLQEVPHQAFQVPFNEGNLRTLWTVWLMDMGKPSSKNGRKEGKTQDFGMWQNYDNLSLGHPKRWLRKGFFLKNPKVQRLQGGPWAELFSGIITPISGRKSMSNGTTPQFPNWFLGPACRNY